MVSRKAKKKLLDKARNSPRGWTRTELDKLYRAYGFEIDTEHSNHDIAYHEDLDSDVFYGTLTRSSGDIHFDYVKHAVKLIDLVLKIQVEKELELEEEEEDESDD